MERVLAGLRLARRVAGKDRDKLMMLIATLSRMGLGIITFLILARYLGPQQFGVIATAMSYAMLLALATDFGLSTFALRQASINTNQAWSVVRTSLATKWLLTIISLPIAYVSLKFLIPSHQLFAYVCVFVGTLIYSFGDLSMIIARAKRRFEVEAGLVVSSSAVMLLGVGGIAAWTSNLNSVSIAFLTTRIVYLLVAHIGLRSLLGPVDASRPRLVEVCATLRDSAVYALDNSLTVFSGQIDVLLFALFLTSSQMGIYQAGARLVQVITPFAVVLSTVYMPALSSASVAADNGEEFRRLSHRVTLEFGVLALLGGAGFLIVGPMLTRLVYGPDYAPLGSLWAGFSAYALMRFAAAGFGIQLAALGKIGPRVAAQVAAMGVFATALLPFGSRLPFGLTAWLLTVIGLVNFLVLGYSLLRSGRADRLVALSLICLPVAMGLVALISTSGHVL